ncbi:MAG: hypothetical protein EPN97_03885 [Alphaproteobacteria bacterium]|nr:MAG: hypothetical protein EPN97_03885 [Alphaproteobacteria bacterium]
MNKLSIFVAICSLIILMPLSALAKDMANGAEEGDPVTHEKLWDEATAAVLAVAATPDIDKVSVDVLKPAQARLEMSVVKLLEETPPVSRLADHLFLLPAMQEVAAATREAVEAKEANDAARIESAQVWVDESLTRLQAALNQVQAMNNP